MDGKKTGQCNGQAGSEVADLRRHLRRHKFVLRIGGKIAEFQPALYARNLYRERGVRTSGLSHLQVTRILSSFVAVGIDASSSDCCHGSASSSNHGPNAWPLRPSRV